MEKISVRPHARSKCAAKTRSEDPCKNWIMKNGRCRLHGGKSTGPKTAEGRERIRRAKWKHGRRSAEAREVQREVRSFLREAKELSRDIRKRFLEGTLTLDQRNAMIEKESDIQSKLLSCREKFQYLRMRDLFAVSKYTQDGIERIWDSLKLFNII